jgi:hypothetical protein
LTSFLSNSSSIPQDATVAQIILEKKIGSPQILPIRAGRETAEWAVDRPGLGCLHRKPLVKESWQIGREGYQGHNYSCRINLPDPIETSKITLQYPSAQGSILIKDFKANGQEIEKVLRNRFQWIEPNIFQNFFCLPRAYMIGRAKVAGSKNELLEQLEQLDPKEAVLVSSLPPNYHEPSTSSYSPNEARVTRYSPDHIVIDTHAREDKFLVLSDTFNPYWKATIDRTPASILKVNYGLRGLYVPGGAHRIEFSFYFYPFYYGLALTCLSLLAVFCIALTAVWRKRTDEVNQKGQSHF